MRIILGSSSHWRKQIFREIVAELGLDEFEVMSPDIDERAIRDSFPPSLTMKIAMAKCAAIEARIPGQDAIIVTGDQVATCGGVIREKPESHEQARYFLRTYRTMPAICVAAMYVKNTETGWSGSAVDSIEVHFNGELITDSIIERIIDEGVIFDASGGFVATNPTMAPLIKEVRGEIESEMGLPRKITTQLLLDALER